MRAATNRTLRRVHLYLGVFFAPAIVFFALTGAVQTFRLNEAKWAPAWLAYSGSVHKNQAAPRPKKPEGPKKPRPPEDAPKGDPALPLKVFVVAMSLGLAASALLGVAVALGIASMRRTTVAMLVLGALVPVALFLL